MAYQFNNMPADLGGFNPEYTFNTPDGPSQGRRVTVDDLAAPFQMAHQFNNMPAELGGFNPEYTFNTPDGPSQGRRMTVNDLAAPFSQEEINSFQAGHVEAVSACINSLGPLPAEMTPEYINWAFQQAVEPFPGVQMTIGMMAASFSPETTDRMNALNVEFAPRNMQIITEQLGQPPQQTNAPQWHLSGPRRILFDCDANEVESYRCSDGCWRILQGEELESARRRTTNLHAPIKAPTPRTTPLKTLAANLKFGNASA